MPPNSSATRPPLLPAITERQPLGLATALTALAGVAAIALVLVQLRHAHGPGPALAVLICVPVIAFGSRWPLPVLALASVAAGVQIATGTTSVLVR